LDVCTSFLCSPCRKHATFPKSAGKPFNDIISMDCNGNVLWRIDFARINVLLDAEVIDIGRWKL
jgi:hypothetical protein